MKHRKDISDMGGGAEFRAAERRARELLDLYFEGETSLAEEEFLTEFFSGGGVPADLEYARGMFAAFGAARSCRLADETPLASAAAAETKSAGGSALRMKVRRVYVAVSAAAAMLLAGGITWALISEKPTVYCYLNGEPVTNIAVAARQADMASRLFESTVRASSEGAAAVSRAAEPMTRLNRILGRINPEE